MVHARSSGRRVADQHLWGPRSDDAPPWEDEPAGPRERRTGRRPGPPAGSPARSEEPRDLPRRPGTARWIVLVLLVQAALTLRLRNGVFREEALLLGAGRDLLARLSESGLRFGEDPYTGAFAGSPYLYPLAAGAIDDHFGLAAARWLSLALLLGATLCVAATARILAGPAAAAGAAAVFAAAQSTQALGALATVDAPALFLIAATGWLAVRSGSSGWFLFPAMVTGAFAATTGYSAALYLPFVCALCVLTAWRTSRKRALMRGLFLAVGTAGLGATLFFLLHAYDGVRVPEREGVLTLPEIVEPTARWAGPALVLAFLGMMFYAGPMLQRMTGRRSPGEFRRVLIALALIGAGLLAPLGHLALGTDAALGRNIGYGLVFTAVMAGVFLAALVRLKVLGPILAVAAVAAAGFLGAVEAEKSYEAWPDTTALGRELVKETRPGGPYLAEHPEIPAYYTADKTVPQDWTAPDSCEYRGMEGREACAKALDDGYFQIVVLAVNAKPGLYTLDPGRLQPGSHYRLTGTYGNAYQLWVRI